MIFFKKKNPPHSTHAQRHTSNISLCCSDPDMLGKHNVLHITQWLPLLNVTAEQH